MKRFKQIIINYCTSQRAVFWTFLCMLVLPNVLMVYTESTTLLTRLIGLVLPLGLYWLVLSLAKKPGKAFWWLFWFIFIDAFQIVLLYLYGESPIAVDMFLNVLTTNPDEAGELLGNLVPAVAAVVIVYGGGIVLSIVSWRNHHKLDPTFLKRQRRVGGIVTAAAVVLTGINLTVDSRFAIEDDIFPINGTYNLGLALSREQQTINYARNAASFSYDARSTRPDSLPEIYVLVIGETARADNFGIYGYQRNTTPRLSAMRSELAIYRDAITMSNTTHKSVPLLLTAVGSQDDFTQAYRSKGLISAFRQAGYRTVWVSNQRRNHSLIDFLGCEAEHVTFIKDGLPIAANRHDDELLPAIGKELAQYHGGKMLLVVHCYGSHFNYSDRYPAQDSRFKPDHVISADAHERPTLLNAYDNTIVHEDRVLSSIIGAVAQKHVAAGLIYVSDHGEDIFDDARQRFLHASPLPTYWQLRVPYVVWTSAEYRAQFPAKWQALLSHEQLPISTNLVTFHTLMDMSGLTCRFFDVTDALSNRHFTTKPRLYVTDHDEFVPLRESGLKPADLEQMSKHGLKL